MSKTRYVYIIKNLPTGGVWGVFSSLERARNRLATLMPISSTVLNEDGSLLHDGKLSFHGINAMCLSGDGTRIDQGDTYETWMDSSACEWQITKQKVNPAWWEVC